jgi:hypothetical protein
LLVFFRDELIAPMLKQEAVVQLILDILFQVPTLSFIPTPPTHFLNNRNTM